MVRAEGTKLDVLFHFRHIVHNRKTPRLANKDC